LRDGGVPRSGSRALYRSIGNGKGEEVRRAMEGCGAVTVGTRSGARREGRAVGPYLGGDAARPVRLAAAGALTGLRESGCLGRREAIALGVAQQLAGASEDGESFVEGGVAHTAELAQLCKRHGAGGGFERLGDALIDGLRRRWSRGGG
jgi:hypothetical protein